MEYEINYSKIMEEVRESKASNVLIQLPDGLKQDYAKILKNLKGNHNLFVWGGSCFGACDIPLYTKEAGIDLIIHFGHEKWY